jgi:hypothetical protein
MRPRRERISKVLVLLERLIVVVHGRVKVAHNLVTVSPPVQNDKVAVVLQRERFSETLNRVFYAVERTKHLTAMDPKMGVVFWVLRDSKRRQRREKEKERKE